MNTPFPNFQTRIYEFLCLFKKKKKETFSNEWWLENEKKLEKKLFFLPELLT